MTVERMGAWCDFVSEADYRDDLAGQQLPESEVEDMIAEFRRAASFQVKEFAVMADGTRLMLHDERGFSSWTRAAGQSEHVDPWGTLTLESVESGVRTTVLPDDANGDEHPWEWLAGLLRAHGVLQTPEQLKQLPYDVEFSERLVARLQPRPAGGLSPS